MHADVCSILQYNAVLAAGQQKPIWSPTWNCDLYCSGSYRIEHRLCGSYRGGHSTLSYRNGTYIL